MPSSFEPPAACPEPARRAGLRRWVPRPYWAVRLSLALVLVLAGCAVSLLAQRLGSMQLERDRAMHAAALEQAARQHLALLQIGRLASTLAVAQAPALARAGITLGQELARAGEQALLLDSLLAAHLADGAEPALALMRCWRLSCPVSALA